MAEFAPVFVGRPTMTRCPHDDNDLVMWDSGGGWYYLHCPGCGGDFTLGGTQVPGGVQLPEEQA